VFFIIKIQRETARAAADLGGDLQGAEMGDLEDAYVIQIKIRHLL
jgi:hypothetical protein